MEMKWDTTKKYGLVLEGGGAKGAYQIGAWKALREAGIRFCAVSGVSVGALNGAMVVMDDIDRAVQIWENIRYSHVMDVDDQKMKEVFRGTFSKETLRSLLRAGFRVLTEKGFDVTPLRNLIAKAADEEKIRSSDIAFYLITYSITDHQLLDLDIRDVEEGLIGDMLLASAYFPAFRNEKLHGKRYTDGGGWNVVPLDSLVKRGYQDIIVIRIYGIGVERKVEIPAGVHVLEIAPQKNLGSVLDFDAQRSKRNMVLGYYDAKKALYGLLGKTYYIDSLLNEQQCYEKLMELVQAAWRREEGQEVSLRSLHKDVFPRIARSCGCKGDWDYRTLYIALLERMADFCRIDPYQIVTEESLYQKIVEVGNQMSRAPWEMEETEKRIRGWAWLWPCGANASTSSDVSDEAACHLPANPGV